jgi:hypothetical protein
MNVEGWNLRPFPPMIRAGELKIRVPEELPVTPSPKTTPTEPAPVPPDPYPDYPRVYGWLFQSWLFMFLLVICAALIFYLIAFI